MFSPFVQAEVATARQYGGTGLGLAICKQLVQMMNGKVGLESKLGEGSTFWFTVVFEKQDETDYQRGMLREPVSWRGAGVTGRILLVDDQFTNRAVALAQLEKLGYIVDAVTSGVEALQALRDRNYDLVLMDCQMPEMDGYEATRRIRKDGNSRVPIIALTASAGAGDMDRCLRAGMNDVLSKPVDLQLLAATLSKWLPADPASDVFDAGELLQRLLGDQRLAATIVKEFVNTFPALRNKLQARAQEADQQGVRTEAHALKGSAASVSAIGLFSVARELERSAGEGEMSRIGELLPKVDEEFERLRSVLQHAGWL